ncbi:hypothetical protein [Dongshaea marina]|uniref:hypothetical protein n=1 Tax=Dongshaea marina TaxID=2047966 RepID=UPI00131F1F06|nr:hypothetical protein [Dongshaea marina]
MRSIIRSSDFSLERFPDKPVHLMKAALTLIADSQVTSMLLYCSILAAEGQLNKAKLKAALELEGRE